MADDRAPPADPRDVIDDELDAILARVPLRELTQTEWEAELAEDIALADADIAAGRFISSESVRRWLDSLDTDNPLPRPQCGE